MTPAELVKNLAAAIGLSEPTVTVYARVLREAGLLTTGARGKNAPPMVLLDAARLLLATVVTDKPSRAAEVITDFGHFKCFDITLFKKNGAFTFKKMRSITNDHTIERAIEELLYIFTFDHESAYFKNVSEFLGPERRPPDCYISILVTELGGEISLPGARYLYHDPFFDTLWEIYHEGKEGPQWKREHLAPARAFIERHRRYRTEIKVEKKISSFVLENIAAGFRER